MFKKKLYNNLVYKCQKIKERLNSVYARRQDGYIFIYIQNKDSVDMKLVFLLDVKSGYARGFEFNGQSLCNEINISCYKSKLNYFYDKSSESVLKKFITKPNDAWALVCGGISKYRNKIKWEELQSDMSLFNDKIPMLVVNKIKRERTCYLFFRNFGKTSIGKCSHCGAIVEEKLKHNDEYTCKTCAKKLEVINVNIKKNYIRNVYHVDYYDKVNGKYILRSIYVCNTVYENINETSYYEYERYVISRFSEHIYERGNFSSYVDTKWKHYSNHIFYHNNRCYKKQFEIATNKCCRNNNTMNVIFSSKEFRARKYNMYTKVYLSSYEDELVKAVNENYKPILKMIDKRIKLKGNLSLYIDNRFSEKDIDVAESILHELNDTEQYEFIMENINIAKLNLNDIKNLVYLYKRKKNIKLPFLEYLLAFTPYLTKAKERDTSKFEILKKDSYFCYIPLADLNIESEEWKLYNHLPREILLNPYLIEMGIKFKANNFLKSLNNYDEKLLKQINNKALVNGIKSDNTIDQIIVTSLLLSDERMSKFVKNYEHLEIKEVLNIFKVKEMIKLELNTEVDMKKIFNYVSSKKLDGIDSADELYKDYIDMQITAKENLNDTRLLFPENLNNAHDAAVCNIKYGKYKKYAVDFMKRLKDLEKYNTENEQFKIEVPRDFMDMFKEGQTMDNCIPSYYKNVASNNSDILFLRRKDEDDQWVPFVDIEIDSEIKKLKQARKKDNKSCFSEIQEGKSDLAMFLKEYSDKHGIIF